MNNVTTQPELLTVDDFAALLQVSTRQIYLMEDDGRLGPARVQIGRAVRFRRREVEGWIVAGCLPRNEWIALSVSAEKKKESDHEPCR